MLSMLIVLALVAGSPNAPAADSVAATCTEYVVLDC